MVAASMLVARMQHSEIREFSTGLQAPSPIRGKQRSCAATFFVTTGLSPRILRAFRSRAGRVCEPPRTELSLTSPFHRFAKQ